MTTFPHATTVEEFRDALDEVRSRVDAAARRSGRRGEDIRLLPVSKTVPPERMRLAIEAGCTRFGENKVQEARRKAEALADTGVEWAIIGHLQVNKAKYVARFATEFQALDSLRVAEALQRRLELESRELDVFVQVNTSAEPQKYGVEPGEIAAIIEALPRFDRLHVKGLMTLAVFDPDPDVVRPCFERLRDLRERLAPHAPEGVSLAELSMGMSGDFELAIEEGATCVRVGQAIFGARSVPDSYYWG